MNGRQSIKFAMIDGDQSYENRFGSWGASNGIYFGNPLHFDAENANVRNKQVGWSTHLSFSKQFLPTVYGIAKLRIYGENRSARNSPIEPI